METSHKEALKGIHVPHTGDHRLSQYRHQQLLHLLPEQDSEPFDLYNNPKVSLV